jgi:hypothetical protein
MEFVNETRLEAGWTLGFQPDGRELLIVAVKATFSIPANGEEPSLAEEQVPLIEADEFNGKPGFSATLHETDYAHRKPLCDVLLNGSAYAPGGRPTKSVIVSLQVGKMKKAFQVVGDRIWDRSLLFFLKPTSPKPFIQLPISYDRAFGGMDQIEGKPDKVKTYLKNPIGIGYYPLTKHKALIGKPLPNTQEIGHPVKKIKGKFEPMSFGPIGRNFEERVPYAGTYSQKWLDTRSPFLPENFDYRYFQAAPAEQQILYPKGEEWVELKNLTPEGLTRFQLPKLSMPVLCIPHQGQDQLVEAVIDTLLIEPDQNRFMLTWRASLPLRRNMFEIRQLIAGEMPYEWYAQQRAEAKGKTYYRSISEFIKAKKGS